MREALEIKIKMKIPCWLNGHRMIVTQRFGKYSYRASCIDCGLMFAESDQLRLRIEWSSEFHRMFEHYGFKIDYQEWEGTGGRKNYKLV